MTRPQRVLPLDPSQWSPQARQAFSVLESSATRDVGPASNVAMAMAHHPDLAKAHFAFGRHLLINSSLSDRIRELVTLRVARRYRSEYEWFHHVRFALRVGVSDEEIEAVKRGLGEHLWATDERSALQAADMLCAQHKIDDDLWADLTSHFSTQQIMDLVFTVGQYAMTAWVISAFEIPIENGFMNADHPLD